MIEDFNPKKNTFWFSDRMIYRLLQFAIIVMTINTFFLFLAITDSRSVRTHKQALHEYFSENTLEVEVTVRQLEELKR